MKNFRIKDDVLFTIDTKGISVVDKKSKHHFFINYPEASVWSVLINNYGIKKSNLVIGAILDKDAADTGIFILQCLRKWKQLNIID